MKISPIKSTLLTAVVSLMVTAMTLPAYAQQSSPGRLANDWAVSEMKHNGEEAGEPSETKLRGNGGGGKVQVQDLQVIRNPAPDIEPMKNKKSPVKLNGSMAN